MFLIFIQLVGTPDPKHRSTLCLITLRNQVYDNCGCIMYYLDIK